MAVRLLTDQQLHLLLMKAIKAYQELVEFRGEEHAAAIRKAADMALTIEAGCVLEWAEQPGKGS